MQWETTSKPGIVIDFEDAIDAALVQGNMLFGGNGHETVGNKGSRVHARGKLPFLPTVIVLRSRQTEGVKRFGAREGVVAPFAGKEAGKKGVIGLANHDDGIVLLENQESAFSGHPVCACTTLSMVTRPVSSRTMGEARLAAERSKPRGFDLLARLGAGF